MSQTPPFQPSNGFPVQSQTDLLRLLVWNTYVLSGGSAVYTPATPADWNGTPPTTIGEALDRLAAVASSPP